MAAQQAIVVKRRLAWHADVVSAAPLVLTAIRSRAIGVLVLQGGVQRAFGKQTRAACCCGLCLNLLRGRRRPAELQ